MHPARGRSLRSVVFPILILAAATAATAVSPASPAPPPEAAAPWGVAGSASSSGNCAEWMPKVAAAGVSAVRLFPEWRALEPSPGKWTWEPADALLKAAGDNRIEVNAILMGSLPWGKSGPHAFPMGHLDDWSDYVSAAAGHCKGRVRYWEVWNEGNGGFNDEHHTATDYAKLAAAAYAAAKKADPDARVGLSVASFDPAYLDQAIRAMARQGTPGRFDFLAVHPYEIADGLADPDGEIPYLWMTRSLRDMLHGAAPIGKTSKSGSPKSADSWAGTAGKSHRGRRGQGPGQALHDGPCPGYSADGVVRGPGPGRRRPGLRPARPGRPAEGVLQRLEDHDGPPRPDPQVSRLARCRRRQARVRICLPRAPRPRCWSRGCRRQERTRRSHSLGT